MLLKNGAFLVDHAPHLQAVHALLLGLHLEGGGDVLDGGQGWVPLLGLLQIRVGTE